MYLWPFISAVNQENARVIFLVTNATANNLVDLSDGCEFVPVVARYSLILRLRNTIDQTRSF